MEAAWRLRPRSVAFSGSDPELVRSTLPALAAPPRQAAAPDAGRDRRWRRRAHARMLRGYGYRFGREAFAKVLDA